MAQTVRYMVKKETEVKKQCKTCVGTGMLGNGRKCIQCKNGVATYWHTTEIELIQALRELGLIKEPPTP